MLDKRTFIPGMFRKISRLFWEYIPYAKGSALLNTMSLRSRLICFVAITLALSLAAEGTIVFFNASRSVRTEMSAALRVGQQIVKSALGRLPESSDRRLALEELVAEFRGNRHLRVSLSGDANASVEPSPGDTYFGAPPSWFARLLGTAPLSARFPIGIPGRDNESIVVETDPKNEVLEVWNSFGDSLLTLLLFFGLSILLIYYCIGRALRPLDQLAAALKQIGHGDHTMRVGGSPVPEVAQLQRSFNRMAIELAALDEEKRRLNERLLTLQEEERGEIARDLHDEVSPFLFAVNADLASIARLAAEGRGAEIAAEIQLTLDAVSHMQRQIKALLLRLRPGVLQDFGLAAAIMSTVDFWRRRRPEICFEVRLPEDSASFGPLIDNAIYRIVQESLTNAVRHGDPGTISVKVREAAANLPGTECIKVEVRNDGLGTDEAADFGFGLTGMRDRVHALGGRLVLVREPSLGLSVTATLPLTAQDNEARASTIFGRA
jgi:two-component system, NarL family, sensor histidine kinase UhpB